MYYVAESIVVGVYSLLIYILVDFKFNSTIKIFIVGFIKHLLGYVLNIHTYYCNYGYACLKYQKQVSIPLRKNNNITTHSKVAKISLITLLRECAFEGCLFVFCNLLLSKIKNNYIRIFILGVLLHIIFEFLQLHVYFCKRCV